VRNAVPLASLLVALTACSKTPTQLSIDLTTGQEKDAFTADPPVTRVDITVGSLDGTVSLKATAAPGGTFDLGTVTDDQQISVGVEGFDKDGNSVMAGLSLGGLPLSGISGASLPVFVQRTLQWARPPGGLKMAHVGGVTGAIGERYVTLTSGAKAAGDTSSSKPTQVDAYDLFSLDGAVSAALPRVPETIVTIGSVQLLLGSDGATWVDYSGTDPATDPALPTGLASFGDVAGGTTVYDVTGARTFVVGGTRHGSASKAVLQVGDDGTLVAYTLLVARKGAAATYVDGVGLVVAGGSDSAPGVEVLGVGANVFSPRGYDPDLVEGAAAVTDGAHGIALLGGTLAGAAAPTRLLDATCSIGCKSTEAMGATLPVVMPAPAVFRFVGTKSIVIGDEQGGMTRTFIVDLGGGGTISELLLKEPRRGATPMPTPLGTLALLGGEHADGTPALTMESFFPP
jgi:hypothetical protein